MNNTTKILIALGTGLLIGGALGILFAPDKGSEIRRKITERGKKFSDAIKNKIPTLKEGIKERMEAMNERIEELV